MISAYLRSIRFRLTVWYSGLLALFLLAFSALAYGAMVGIMQEQRVVLEEQKVVLEVTSQDGERLMLELPRSALGQRARTIGCPPGVRRPDERCGPTPSIFRGDEGVAEDPTEPIRLPAGAIGRTDIVRAGFDEQTQRDIQRALLQSLLAIVPALLALSLLGGGLLAHYALAPLGAITRAARRIREGDLSARIRLEGGGSELRELADTFDEMVDAVAAMIAREQRFVGDASHELQTPLAVIRTTADVALGDPDTTPDARDALRSIVEGTERMSRIVDDLLLLSTYGHRSGQGTEVELRTLVRSALQHLRPLADEKRVSLHLASGSALRVTTDQARLERAVTSLVENAIKYTEHGSVRVELSTGGGGASISIHDTGRGIAPEHLPRLFERFYRVDAGRSRAAGGTGLGLAIAQEAVRSIGGSIRVESAVGEGSTFTIHLPGQGTDRARG